MLSNLQILLVVLASVIFLTVLYFFYKPVFTRSLIQNSLDDSKSLLFESELEQGTLGFNDEDAPQQEQELIILNLVSMDKSNFDINQVHTLLKNLDAKYIDGFFSYRDIHGKEIFRIASGINPGLLKADVKTHVLLLAHADPRGYLKAEHFVREWQRGAWEDGKCVLVHQQAEEEA